mmetsp:Transcript_52902/g.123335  ORF Transcript_52902/g.123335 Transcript_52902/m.123335 type:complete len:121 (-) Transcript_52902:218-580(-)
MSVTGSRNLRGGSVLAQVTLIEPGSVKISRAWEPQLRLEMQLQACVLGVGQRCEPCATARAAMQRAQIEQQVATPPWLLGSVPRGLSSTRRLHEATEIAETALPTSYEQECLEHLDGARS